MPRSDPGKRRALVQARTLHPASERVRAAVFLKHPDFFDASDELQVKYEMLRAHFLDGQPVTTVSAAFGYSRQTFYLLRAYFGEVEHRFRGCGTRISAKWNARRSAATLSGRFLPFGT